MTRTKIGNTLWPLLVLVLLALMLPGCKKDSIKPTLKDFAPKGGCSERTAGLPYPPPPTTELLIDWKLVYLEGARAKRSEVELRINTADCLDKHRAPKKRWWQK